MALKIRLARGGSKKRPYYRIVVAEVTSPRDGRYVEKVGTYNPMLQKDDENRVRLVEDRIKHWLSVGALPTDRVARFLEAAGMAKAPERNNPNKGKPGQKRLDREAAAAEAKIAAEEAAAAEKEAAIEAAKAAKAAAKAAAEEAANAPVEEAPAEEAPAEEAPADEAAS